MAETDNKQSFAKAMVFFERASKVGRTGNFDYAIDMYLEGLRCAPGALEEGHIKLHELALMRQSRGGKKPTMTEKIKRMRSKTHIERLLNAEYLFAKDPENLTYAEAMLKASAAGGFKEVAGWIADFIFEANKAADKPSFQRYLLLKDSYVAVGQFDKALAACKRAVDLKPNHEELSRELQNLSAELTVARGKYDQAGDFRKAIKNRASQEKLHAQDGVVKSETYRASALEQARKAYAQNPNLPKNIFNLAETLSDLRNDSVENEAIELLEAAYKKKSDFSFKQQAGRIKIKQIKRKIRQAKTSGQGSDEQAGSMAKNLTERLNSIELEHYRLCVENYPTDLRAKYEYGLRLVTNKKYDQAIPLFQEVQRDPRNKVSAMSKIGLCFFKKGWFTDAVDVFNQAIESHQGKEDEIGKELRYNLGRAYEQQGETKKALEIYRKIAQLDFAYKDVRKRVDKLRSNKSDSTSGQDF